MKNWSYLTGRLFISQVLIKNSLNSKLFFPDGFVDAHLWGGQRGRTRDRIDTLRVRDELRELRPKPCPCSTSSLQDQKHGYESGADRQLFRVCLFHFV